MNNKLKDFIKVKLYQLLKVKRFIICYTWYGIYNERQFSTKRKLDKFLLDNSTDKAIRFHCIDYKYRKDIDYVGQLCNKYKIHWGE